jgi:hypothetical protein
MTCRESTWTKIEIKEQRRFFSIKKRKKTAESGEKTLGNSTD